MYSHRPSHTGPQLLVKGQKKDDNRLNAVTIIGVNFDAPESNYFQLECIGEIYSMQCNAAYLDADAEHAD